VERHGEGYPSAFVHTVFEQQAANAQTTSRCISTVVT
jgi:hypothetical protein